MLSAPAQTMSTFRALGVRMVRIIVVWAQIAPGATARKAPTGFNASNPSSYPQANWAPYDEMIELAHEDGLGVDLTLSGGAPRWAEGPGIPASALDNQFWAWRPSASAFGQFVRAAGQRYSGTYVPPGQTAPLPRVNFWAVWNEPNFGEDLGPQAIDGSTVSVAPGMYRSLAGQMWNGLQATGHGHDTFLIGEFAPMGLSGAAGPGHPQGLPGDFSQTKPLQFVRTLYCLDSNYRELRGRAARSVGCPTTAAGSRSFRRQNPALFNATGVADHPYSFTGSPPNVETSTDPDIATFPRIPNLEHALDRVQRVYGSGKRFPIYNTEYGYITHPPNRFSYPSPATAAYYINWAEYLSWKQPRVATTMQYLLYDPTQTAATVPWRRRLRERPGDRQRQGQARVRRLPPAAAPTGDLDPAWPLARGVGVRTAGAVRDPRWRPAADGSDPVRASRFVGHVFCDAPHGDDLEREQLLLRRADEVPRERHGQARLHVPERSAADVPAGGVGLDRVQPVGGDHAAVGGGAAAARLGGVHRVDLGLVLGLDRPALQLHRRRQLVAAGQSSRRARS